jgi:pyruvate kinase
VALSTASVTEKDYEDLEHGLAQGVDLVALSFVRRAADVRELRSFVERRGAHLPLVAKIEKPEGVAQLAEILEVADGVMVARGDLGVEMPLEQVPQIQKRIIDQARRRGRFVITATQMLESMIEHPVPTRAEVSDVANAIYDGTDAVMLSAETSAGRFPAEAVRMMARIAEQADAAVDARGYVPLDTGTKGYSAIIADAAVAAASEAGLKAIVVFTTSGSTARLVSRLRPPVPVYAFTPDERVARQLAVQFGVRAVTAPRVASVDEMLRQVDEIAIRKGLLAPGDCVAFVSGVPIGRPGTTNTLKLHRAGELNEEISLY